MNMATWKEIQEKRALIADQIVTRYVPEEQQEALFDKVTKAGFAGDVDPNVKQAKFRAVRTMQKGRKAVKQIVEAYESGSVTFTMVDPKEFGL